MNLRSRSLKITAIALALIVLTVSLIFVIRFTSSSLPESTRRTALSDPLLPSFVLLFPVLHHALRP